MPLFTLTLSADADFNASYDISVPDGVDCRAHDLRLVLEGLIHEISKAGGKRLPTVSEVAARKAKELEAAAVLAEWEPTLDGVSCYGGVYSRTYVKQGHTEAVVAVCAADGSPTMDTAATLSAWRPTEA